MINNYKRKNPKREKSPPVNKTKNPKAVHSINLDTDPKARICQAKNKTSKLNILRIYRIFNHGGSIRLGVQL